MKEQIAALQTWVKANPKKAVLLGVGAGVLAWYGSKRLGAGSPRAEYVPGEIAEDAAGISLGEDPIEPLPLAFDDYYPTGLLPSYTPPPPSGNGSVQYNVPINIPTQSYAAQDRGVQFNPLAPSVIYDLYSAINVVPQETKPHIFRQTVTRKTSDRPKKGFMGKEPSPKTTPMRPRSTTVSALPLFSTPAASPSWD